MTRTPTKPPTDRGMWRKLKARVHPDVGGSHEEFLWVQALEEAIRSGEETTESRPPRREPRPEPPKPESRIVHEEGRVPFPKPADFETLTARALATAAELSLLYGHLLLILEDCEPVDYEPLYDQQQRGATYKQLAAIGHGAGMSKAERVRWYRIAESIPMSCRHAGHILSQLKRGQA